jgi:hypothetical protein
MQVFICNWIFRLERCCQMQKKVCFFVTGVDSLLIFGRKVVKQTEIMRQFQSYPNECINYNSLVHRLIP